MVDYTVATDIQQQTYNLIATNNAFDTSPVDYATLLQNATLALAGVIGKLPNIDQSFATSLTSTAAVHGDLVAHLDDHYTNLIDNLSLATSAISDAIGYGVIGTSTSSVAGSLANPLASIGDFFGSIMGSSNLMVAQSSNQIAGVTATAAATTAGCIISSIVAATGVAPAITAALGTLANPVTLSATLTNPTAANLALLASVMTAIVAVIQPPVGLTARRFGTNLFPSLTALGTAETAIGSVGNLSNLADSLSSISSIAGLGNLASAVNIDSLGATLTGLTSSIGSLQGAIGGILNGSPAGIAAVLGGITGNADISSLLGGLTATGGGLGTALSSLGGVSGLSGLTNALSGLTGGNLSSMLGNLTGGLSGQLSGLLSGNIGSLMGGLSGITGGLTGMISGEIGQMSGAISQLTNMASAGALTSLLGNSGAASVLGMVGTPALKATASDAASQSNSSTDPCADCSISNSGQSASPAAKSTTPAKDGDPAGPSVDAPDGKVSQDGSAIPSGDGFSTYYASPPSSSGIGNDPGGLDANGQSNFSSGASNPDNNGGLGLSGITSSNDTSPTEIAGSGNLQPQFTQQGTNLDNVVNHP